MFSYQRFLAVFKGRNIEFFRDKSSLGWNLIFPILLLVGFSFVFSNDNKTIYKVGVIKQLENNNESLTHPFLSIKHMSFISYKEIDQAKEKLTRHSIDFIVDLNKQEYWLNELSPNSYLVSQIFLAYEKKYKRQVLSGKAIRYVDWVLPGILGMNMMFSCLFGVGYVIVRYRKNHVLKRLKATPLNALEFVTAQLVSRLFIVLTMSSIVYIGCNFMFNFYMLGSYIDLLVIGLLGAFSLITLGLLVASRSKSEELIGGLLNLTSWPMMILSGVWFSLEGAPNAIKIIADFFPLTHLVAAARKIMTEGATLMDVSYHVSILCGMSVLFLLLGAYLFSWNTER